jgi:hypothetical protein
MRWLASDRGQRSALFWWRWSPVPAQWIKAKPDFPRSMFLAAAMVNHASEIHRGIISIVQLYSRAIKRIEGYVRIFGELPADKASRTPPCRLRSVFPARHLPPRIHCDLAKHPGEQPEGREHSEDDAPKQEPMPFAASLDDFGYRLPLLHPFAPVECVVVDERRLIHVVHLPHRIRPTLFAVVMDVEDFGLHERASELSFLGGDAESGKSAQRKNE